MNNNPWNPTPTPEQDPPVSEPLPQDTPKLPEQQESVTAQAPAQQAPAQQAPPQQAPAQQAPVEQRETLQFSSIEPTRPPFPRDPIPTPPPYGTYAQSAPEGFAPSQKKKKGKGLKILAFTLAVVALLAIGVGGGYLLSTISQPTGAPEIPETEESSPTEEAGNANSTPIVPPDDKDPIFTPDTEAEDAMDAKEIYSSNVNSIVGVSVEGEMYNIFGSVSAYASSGTGFILNEEGYILTNYHVVQGKGSVTTPKITVTLYSGDKHEAKVIGYDEFSDVALIKIEATGLDPISIGDSDKLVAGESVAIIGHPLGELTYSISKGIVAAVNREIAVENKRLEMFQIDAAVNSGNSGGPAFNEKGQVVGIVTSKYASSSIEGLGFCIPINNAVKIANDLINYGFVRGQAGLGVTIRDVYSTSGFYQQSFGAQIQSIQAGSCAEKAGLQTGDIIIGIDNTRITGTDDLNAAKSNYKMGDTVTLTLYRNSEEIEVELTFDEFIPEQYSQTTNEA